MHIRAAGLALPVVIGIGVAVTSCSGAPGTVKPAVSATRSASAAAVSGSPAPSPAAPSPTGSVPAGYKRVGGAAQGISLAAPASWVVADLTKESPESVASKIHPSGSSAATAVQQLDSLQKLHAILVYDPKYVEGGPRHFVPNFNATCGASGTADVGAAGIPVIKAYKAAQLKTINATHVTAKDLNIGGVPGVELSYQYSPAGDYGTLYGSQLAVLPKPHKICLVTATVGEGQSLGSVFSVAAATAQFP